MLPDNSIELTFHQIDLENVYFDEEKDDFVETDANLLEMIFPDDVVKILNSCGLTDELIRKIYKEHEGYNVRFDQILFKFQFEIEPLDMPDVNNPLQKMLFNT